MQGPPLRTRQLAAGQLAENRLQLVARSAALREDTPAQAAAIPTLIPCWRRRTSRGGLLRHAATRSLNQNCARAQWCEAMTAATTTSMAATGSAMGHEHRARAAPDVRYTHCASATPGTCFSLQPAEMDRRHAFSSPGHAGTQAGRQAGRDAGTQARSRAGRQAPMVVQLSCISCGHVWCALAPLRASWCAGRRRIQQIVARHLCCCERDCSANNHRGEYGLVISANIEDQQQQQRTY